MFTETVNQGESTESSESHKEEKTDEQNNTDKSKGEVKAVTEENTETSKKEVNHTSMMLNIFNIICFNCNQIRNILPLFCNFLLLGIAARSQEQFC